MWRFKKWLKTRWCDINTMRFIPFTSLHQQCRVIREHHGMHILYRFVVIKWNTKIINCDVGVIRTNNEDIADVLRLVWLQFDVADGQNVIKYEAVVADVVIHGLNPYQMWADFSVCCYTCRKVWIYIIIVHQSHSRAGLQAASTVSSALYLQCTPAWWTWAADRWCLRGRSWPPVESGHGSGQAPRGCAVTFDLWAVSSSCCWRLWWRWRTLGSPPGPGPSSLAELRPHSIQSSPQCHHLQISSRTITITKNWTYIFY